MAPGVESENFLSDLNLVAIVIPRPLSYFGKYISESGLDDPLSEVVLGAVGKPIPSCLSGPFQYTLSILYTAPGDGVFTARDCL